jgi:hypothetical protein
MLRKNLKSLGLGRQEMELEDIPDWLLQLRVRNFPLNDVIREEIERRYFVATGGYMKYRVRRQDDHGNVFTVPQEGMWYETFEEAIAIKQVLEEYHHKQMYWIEVEEGRRRGKDYE